MSDQEKKESQKTIVAFATGLLVGGLLVWIFSGAPKTEAPKDSDDAKDTKTEVTTEQKQEAEVTGKEVAISKPALVTGEGKIEVKDQKAGTAIALDSAVYPTDEGWIGVRDYADGKASGLLGVARFSKEQGLVPETVQLQRATEQGKTYAVVFYTESGDRNFNFNDDKLVETVTATFTAK